MNLYATSAVNAATCAASVWARLNASGIKPVAMTYYIPGPYSWGQPHGVAQSNIRALNAQISQLARLAGVALVDLEPLPVTMSDGLHPDEAGARLIASAIH